MRLAMERKSVSICIYLPCSMYMLFVCACTSVHTRACVFIYMSLYIYMYVYTTEIFFSSRTSHMSFHLLPFTDLKDMSTENFPLFSLTLFPEDVPLACKSKRA